MASSLFGGCDIDHAQSMHRSPSDPTQWTLAVRIPRGTGTGGSGPALFAYKYVALDANSQVWEEAGPARTINPLMWAGKYKSGLGRSSDNRSRSGSQLSGDGEEGGGPSGPAEISQEDHFSFGNLWLGRPDAQLTGF